MQLGLVNLKWRKLRKFPEHVASLRLGGRALEDNGDAKDPPVAAFENHQRALAVLDELLEASEKERAAWFAEAGASDPALASQVALLLRADARGSQSLPTGIPQAANEEAAAPPDRIGPYKLVVRLGQGGMGEVFLGEREDGLFEQQVAIKLIRTGQLSPRLAMQFVEERRILARLQHPHIAQLFDGGVDASGHSYIVMEYLQGKIITDYVRDERPDLDTVLQLFLDVCSAVQFAHQNLVVHADIKPNNIVVTPKSGVKLLDFGISRLIDPSQVVAAVPGALEPMTRAYAAPERLVGAAVTVASDVYSLGALLFELLVGTLPEVLTETDQHTVAVSAIGPSNWTKPSSEVRRRAELGTVKASQLVGDLDAIVAKALAPQVAQRYMSVAELSEDIERHRRRLPVKALPQTWLYVSSKFVRRHRLGLALTGSAMLALTLAAGGMTKLYLDSERDRALAVQRFGETRNMANYIIAEADPQLARLPGSLALRRNLVSRSQVYLQALERDSNAPPAIRLEVANGYVRLARIYGLDINAGIGDVPAARQSIRHAVAILDALSPSTVDTSALLLARADAEMTQANEVFLSPDGRTIPMALGKLSHAADKYSEVLRLHPDNVDAALGLWRSQVIQARVLSYLGRPADAVALVEATLNRPRPKPVKMSQVLEANFISTGALLILSENYEDLKQPEKALESLTELNDKLTKFQAQGMGSIESEFMQTSALAGMGRILYHSGQIEPAIARYQESLALMRRILLFGDNHLVSEALIQQSVGLADVYSKAGRVKEARELMATAIADSEARAKKTPQDGGAQRKVAIYLMGASLFEHRMEGGRLGCSSDVKAWNQWVIVQERGGVLPMDTNPNMAVPRLQDRLKACGHVVDLKHMTRIAAPG